MIKKILIANRGEIACRVIRACRELNISPIAVYSKIDEKALHTQLADESVCIGEAPPLQSYLNLDAIIDASKKKKVDAIHPGYGFLAENVDFAKRCEAEKITFIGPHSKALGLVGDKVASRKTMIKANIPVIPGMETITKNIDELKKHAKDIGYPVILKASLGGGGKGMRIIRSENELKSAVEAGMREAKSAFGDESIYLERYIEEPRHIEFQVLADNFGNAIHCFERECSTQRRHQKIVEESPSVVLTPELRRKMGATAIKAIKAAGYTNAGTVEFLLDKQNFFYFLEVNARIQVEHPITELVVGIDLVKQQILIAENKELTLKQEELTQRGHAIEARIYAEDPANDFLPSPGKIQFLEEPHGPGIRIDSGIYNGWEVPTQYDPILSKLIAYGATREEARIRLTNALKKYIILGIKTNIEFLRDVINHEKFIKGETYTSFVSKYMGEWKREGDLDYAIIAAAISMSRKSSAEVGMKKTTSSPWLEIGEWEICKR